MSTPKDMSTGASSVDSFLLRLTWSDATLCQANEAHRLSFSDATLCQADQANPHICLGTVATQTAVYILVHSLAEM